MSEDRPSEAQSRHPFTRGQVVEIRTGKRAGQRHPVLDVYHAYQDDERAGVSIRDEDTEVFYGLDEVSALVCGCVETYPQLVTGQVSHHPRCEKRSGEAVIPRDFRDEPCMRCKAAKSEGWENGWRLRLCLPCSTELRDCNGDPLDFSPDTETPTKSADGEKK